MTGRPFRRHAACAGSTMGPGSEPPTKSTGTGPVEEIPADMAIAPRGAAGQAHGAGHRVAADDPLIEKPREHPLRAERQDRLHPDDGRTAVLDAAVRQAQDAIAPPRPERRSPWGRLQRGRSRSRRTPPAADPDTVAGSP